MIRHLTWCMVEVMQQAAAAVIAWRKLKGIDTDSHEFDRKVILLSNA